MLRSETFSDTWEPFKDDEKCFMSPVKPFLLKYLSFCPDICGHVVKWLDKVNFKIYDLINWETINYNVCIAQYLKK